MPTYDKLNAIQNVAGSLWLWAMAGLGCLATDASLCFATQGHIHPEVGICSEKEASSKDSRRGESVACPAVSVAQNTQVYLGLSRPTGP